MIVSIRINFKLKNTKDYVIQWKTKVANIESNNKVIVNFSLPEFSTKQ